MATLKACIVKKDMRRDKTWRVQIRLTHCRKVRMIPTSMYVTRADLTSAYEIKNEDILEQCREIISGYKEKIANAKETAQEAKAWLLQHGEKLHTILETALEADD